MVGLGEGLTDHLPGRDALGQGHLIDGREDLSGQGFLLLPGNAAPEP